MKKTPGASRPKFLFLEKALVEAAAPWSDLNARQR
jgi:hypothetical protein